MLDNLVYVRMNTKRMENFNTLKAKDMEPINLENLNKLLEYFDQEIDSDNIPLDNDISWFDKMSDWF